MDWALELAENANTYTPLGPQDERIFNDRFVLWMGRANQPSWNVAQRFRLRDNEVESVRQEVHAILQERGRTACSWEVGSHATPPDLVERLYELGLRDDTPDALAIGMALTEAPPAAPAGVEVRRAETVEERREAARIAAIAFGHPAAEQILPAPDPNNVVYLAFVDGEAVARGSASFSEHGATLFGGSTLPEARGRGAYRALVAARWDDAVRRGTPLVVTQAGAMSRPILERIGFRAVCEIRILVDDFAG